MSHMQAEADKGDSRGAGRSGKLLQQRLGLLEICRIKALGEPAVNRCEQLVGFGALALPLPQPSQAHGRPQLQGFRPLTPSDVEGSLEAGFGFPL
jgi:hypothetical protein